MATQDTTFVPNSTNFTAAMAQPINDFVWKGRNAIYATSTGTSTAYTITLPSPSLATSLVAGDSFTWKVHTTNTSAATLTVVGNGSLGSKPLVRPPATPLTTGQLVAGSIVTTVYDGTSFQVLVDTTGGGGGGGGGATFTKIAILGDSVSALNSSQRGSWPEYLGRMLNEMGSPCQIFNFGVSGSTFFRNNTVATFGSKTPVQAVIDMAPDIVLVMLGANDLLVKQDSRSVAQVTADASTMRSTLASALPLAKIIYISELCYDVSNFTPSTLLNKGILPAFMTLRSSGILSGCYCVDILSDTVASGTKTDYQNWADFDSSCKALPWTNTITYNHFKTVRLGTAFPDGLHVNAVGLAYAAAQILKSLGPLSSLSTLLPTLSTHVTETSAAHDVLFSGLLQPSGNGYVEIVSDVGEKFSFTYNATRDYLPGEWYYPYKSKLTVAPTTTLSASQRTPILFRCIGLVPNAQVYLSTAGGAFSPISLLSDDRGEIMYITNAGDIGITAGLVIRYKIGNTITPPVTLVITA